MKKKVMITGAGRRLGLYLSKEFYELGWTVYAITRNKNQDLLSLSEKSRRVKVIEISDYTPESFKYILDNFISFDVDVLINNASIFENDLELNVGGVEQYLKLFNIHMVIPSVLIECFQRSLCEIGKRGVVINVTDIFSENPSSSQALYCSTKAGLESLTKSLAKKYANVMRVNSIQPGPIKFLPEHTEEEKIKVLSQTLLAMESGFYPILQAARFIIDNDYVTGTAIKVDGGRSINSW